MSSPLEEKRVGGSSRQTDRSGGLDKSLGNSEDESRKDQMLINMQHMLSEGSLVSPFCICVGRHIRIIRFVSCICV